MHDTSLRTQIILPKDLRDEIDKQRRITGESLAEYLRAAAKDRLKREKRRKANLKKLADEIFGSVRKKRSEAEVEAWIREIREDRRRADKRLEKQWRLARKKRHVPS